MTSNNHVCAFIFIACFSVIIEASINYQLNGNKQCNITFIDGTWEETDKLTSAVQKCMDGIKYGTPAELNLLFRNCSLPAFPIGSLSNLGRVRRLRVDLQDHTLLQLLAPTTVQNSSIRNSSFGDVFWEVRDSLTLVGWRWTFLAPLTSTAVDVRREFSAVRSTIVYLSSDFGLISGGGLTAIRVLDCGLRRLGVGVFRPFSRLKTLELRGNRLEAIQRTHLPRRAPGFSVLDLGKNRLVHLPIDICDNLPIKKLILDGNPLKITGQLVTAFLWNLVFISGDIWSCEYQLSPELSLQHSNNNTSNAEITRTTQ